MGGAETFSGKALSADAALMAARQTPTVRKGQYTPEQARKVAEDFEAVFLSQMIQPMFEGIEAEEPFGGGASEKMWKTLQVDEYGKALAKSGGVGIADSVMRQLLEVQEGR